VEEPDRLGIDPVGVVGDQQQRAGGREDRVREGVEQAQPLLALRERQLGGAAELREHAGELRAAVGVEPVTVGGEGLGPQPGGHRPVGERALGGV